MTVSQADSSSDDHEGSRFRLIRAAGAEDDFGREVRAGLTRQPKTLPCRFIYDSTGSELFDEICELPEYYLTRAEGAILRKHADDIVAQCPPPTCLVELGSGSADKTRFLIGALLRREKSLHYLPIDVSEAALVGSKGLLDDFDRLSIVAIAGSYGEGLRRIPEFERHNRLIVWLGSSIGNLPRERAAEFLAEVREGMTPSERLLLGLDLRKDRATLERAYNDARGVTARFNRNLLVRINRELHGDLDLGNFRYQAEYDTEAGRVAMYQVSECDQQAVIRDLDDLHVSFQKDERIHTESSYKFSQADIDELVQRAGFRREGSWYDDKGLFCDLLLAP